MFDIGRYKTVLLGMLFLSSMVIISCGGGSDTLEAAAVAEGRWGHSATLLNDGRVLVVGGQLKPSIALTSAEIYDPSTGAWSSAGSMSVKRGEGHTATLLNDGTVLIAGDDEYSSAEIYDPSNNSWSSAGTTNDARQWASADLLSDGRVLVAGGLDVTKTGKTEFFSSEIYDPSTGEWTASGVMEMGHTSHSSVVIDDKIIVFGEKNAEIFDPSTGTWSSAGIPNVERTQGTTATLMKNGKVMISGGGYNQEGWTGQYHVMATVQLYDPSNSTFTSTTIMTEPRQFHTAILQDDGSVMVVGSKQIETYDTGTALWTPVANMMTEHGEAYTATQLKDGRILVVGGKIEIEKGKFAGITSVEIFDPSAVE